MDPDDVDALYNKGVALDDLGKYEEAITWHEKALKIDPVDIDILNNKTVAISKLTLDFPGTNLKTTVLLLLLYLLSPDYHSPILPLFLFKIVVPETSS